MGITNNELAVERTRLANQRTYLAYMRTGFAIATIAGAFNKKWIALFGVFMIFGSIYQYNSINDSLSLNHKLDTHIHDTTPIIYTVLSLGVIALYMDYK